MEAKTKTNGTSRNFRAPDEIRRFADHGRLELLKFSGDASIGRGTFEPGWRWSRDVKPLAGTDTCQAPHLGYCISGSMVVRMDTGELFRVQAGEAFEIPPGHDAWVDGDRPCVLLDFTGYRDYAKPRSHEARVRGAA